MRKIVCVLALLVSMISTGCKIDEQAFYIEHMKVPPEAPKCVSSVSDAASVEGVFDLGFRSEYGGFFQVSNHLVAKESYENSQAESNGIIIDGAEVYVNSMGGKMIGSTEYFQFENYIEPESTDIAYGLAIPASITAALAEGLNCPDLFHDDPEDFVVGQNVGVSYEAVYSVVRFIGHTQGHLEVETPEFTYPISICCGCLVNWSVCGSECSKRCTEPDYENSMCQAGVMNAGFKKAYDCRQFYYQDGSAWCTQNCAAEE
jgi:hypothetical protein